MTMILPVPLFANAAEPKQFISVDGAGHVDLHAFLRNRYEQIILEFLEQNLK